MAKKKSFETDLQALQSLATKMEKGDLSLDEALKSFEKGLKLARSCQNALVEAEQKIEQLVEEDGELFAQPLDEELELELDPDEDNDGDIDEEDEDDED
jgi:exodeoxyribonuclease VII small subunit